MQNPIDVIKRKRSGETLSREELSYFIQGFVAGDIPDYQMSAFLMAVYFKDMVIDEILDLVDIMRHSGSQLDLKRIEGFKLDKHSTGGVGDKVSLILAPLLAAMGLVVPMISGRGLGHSGGTVDKLEAIPGLDPRISLAKIRKSLEVNGFVIAGQTRELVPADKKMYALRDATATVESLPLVVGSIMSKKLAENLDGLILDIKTGTGAFFKRKQDALELGSMLMRVGLSSGVKTRAFLTNMNQPLGLAAGNWIEVREAIHCLQGRGPEDTMELVYSLAQAAMQVSGNSMSTDETAQALRKAISGGFAFEKFVRYAHGLGGDTKVLEDPERYRLPMPGMVLATTSGYVAAIDAFEIGMSCVEAGAGRTQVTDPIDPGAGVLLQKKVGERVSAEEPLAQFYTQSSESEAIIKRIRAAIKITQEAPGSEPEIWGEINTDGKLEPVARFSP